MSSRTNHLTAYKTLKIKKTAVDIIVGLFVLLFIYTAVSKLMDYDETELSMSKSPIITEFAHILVWLVPVLEIVISLLLLWPKSTLWGLYSAFGLMVMFTAYIVFILNFSDHIPCSCGGVISSLSWSQHLIFNIAFIILALIAISLNPERNND